MLQVATLPTDIAFDQSLAIEHPTAAPVRAVPPQAVPMRRFGVAAIQAHHGEIVQGVFHDCDGRLEHGLVTLPCSVYGTRVRFRPTRSGPLTVEPDNRHRAHAAARLTLDALGRTGWGGAIRIESDVPLGWGCGSSTTDVVTTIWAVADAFDVTLEPEWIAMLSVAAETASDSLMFASGRAVLFAQRRGRMLRDLGGPLPRVCVLGFNTETDRGVGTLSLPPCNYSSWEIEAFRAILGLLRRAVEQQDPVLLGRVATASAQINQRHRPKRYMSQLLQIAKETGAAGLQVAHSGTVAGLIFEPGRQLARQLEDARAWLRRIALHNTWEFFTNGHCTEGDSREQHRHQREFRGRHGAPAHRLAAGEPDRAGVSSHEAAAGAVHHPQGARGAGARTGRPDRRVHLGDVRAGAGDGRAVAAASAHARE